ncbi:hypothetical protein DRO64_10195 [Candidatus Bathyarchaeota archaeon]|nr:MAG: hypothetical protein DRO64_10195 [Candidatus Bathyarchaeota archaeon]
MKADKIWLAGLAVTILLIILTVTFIAENGFPSFKLAKYEWNAVKISDRMGAEVASFTWNSRSIDVIGQIIVLFGAAVGCLLIFRREGEKRDEYA